MKKRLCLLLILLIPSSVFAYDLKCSKNNLEYGDYFTCDFLDEAKNKEYKLIEGMLELPEYIDCSYDNFGMGLTGNRDGLKFSANGTITTNKIFSIKCQFNKKIETSAQQFISVKNLHYINKYDQEDSNILVRSGYINVKAYEEHTTTKPRGTANADSLLSSIEEPNLNIVFSRFYTEYNVEVLFEVEKLNLKLTTLNPDANVRIVGSQNLSLGNNVIDIYVTSPDLKSTTCYTLNIKRLARGEEVYYEEKDATLSGLSIAGVGLKFDPNINEYNIVVKSDVNELVVSPILSVEGANVIVTGNKEIHTGSIVTIKVTSKDKSTENKYIIKVTKEKAKIDYTAYIIIGIVILTVIILIIIIVKLGNQSKDDPILSIKHSKRKINKGQKLDESIIPEAQNSDANNDEDIERLL